MQEAMSGTRMNPNTTGVPELEDVNQLISAHLHDKEGGMTPATPIQSISPLTGFH
jgi:hypothetical protein